MPSGGVFGFGPYQLDVRSRRLVTNGAPVDLSVRQFDLLHALIAAAGTGVSKGRLIDVAWKGIAVGDSGDGADVGSHVWTIEEIAALVS